MKKFIPIATGLLFTLVLISGFANDDTTGEKVSSYIAEQTRQIKSLSANDIKALQSGAGWGLAKPAELNGIPGPLHVLELQEELGLSRLQKNKIQDLWSSMNEQAKLEGDRYLDVEEKIEEFFKSKKDNEEELDNLLNQSATHLAALRKTHLLAHLEVLPILSFHQIKKYNVLRGYQDHGRHNH